MRIPLFPLNTVLFPGGPLTLRIFERRYLDMVCDCMRDNTPFGVALIREGKEVGEPAQPHPVGTLCHIIDWDQRSDGLLGITVQGERRFLVRSQETGPDKLLIGKVTLLEEIQDIPLPPDYQELRNLLQRILEQIGGAYTKIEPHFDDAAWVAARLSEILPLPLQVKQMLLELDEPRERLDALYQAIVRRDAS